MIWTTDEINALQDVRKANPHTTERELATLAMKHTELRGRTKAGVYARIRQMFGTGGWFASMPVSHHSI